jgi:hypothetical protein
MAYDKVKIYEQAKELVIEKKLFFVEDVIALLPISKQTYYDFFKVNSYEYDTIKDLLDKNKVEVKTSMRSKWYKSENATLQLALMKLIGTEEEAHRLNGSNHKISGDRDNPLQNQMTINVVSTGVAVKTKESDIDLD